MTRVRSRTRQYKGIQGPAFVAEGESIVKVIDETENIVEGIVASSALNRAIDETVNIVEGIVKSMGLVRIRDGIVNIAEGIVKTKLITKVIDDVVNINEGVEKVLGQVKIIDETVNINEGIVKTKLITKILSEIVNIQAPGGGGGGGQVTNLQKPDAAERSTTNTSLTEITQRTVPWSDLTTAGFAADDVVFMIWNFSLGGGSASVLQSCNIGHGTTFAGRTDFFPVDPTVEPQSSVSLNGHRHLGWVEEHTLVVNEDIYFSLRTTDTPAARSANFNLTIIKKADLAAGDFRYDSQANAIAVDTNFSTGRDAAVTLPSSGGDNWLIISCGLWDMADIAVSIEQRISIDGVDTNMLLSYEAEDILEQLPFMCVYPLDSAAASQVITFEGREVSASSNVLDESRMLALRLGAFADHITLHDKTTDALSTTPDTFVETGTVDLVLGETGDVFVIGQSVIDPSDTNADPYLRLQEGGADIISAMGRASDHARDATDLLGIVVHVIGSMTSGTKNIDMDVAQDENTSAADAVERSLIAFSLELAGGAGFEAIAVLALNRILNEVVNINEDIVKSQILIKILNEQERINEEIVKTKLISKSINETVNINEVVERVLGQVKVIDEVVNINEETNKTKGISKSIDETVNINEAVVKVRDLIRIINETESIVEGLVVARVLVRLINEAENINEVTVRALALVRIINETENIVEDVQKVLGQVKVIDEAININEATNKTKVIFKIIDETENIQEAIVKTQILVRILSETESIVEGILNVRTLNRIINEIENIQENVVKSMAIVRILNETINIVEGIVTFIIAPVAGFIKATFRVFSSVSSQLNVFGSITSKVKLRGKHD